MSTVSLEDLKDTLGRFRLVGPLSQAVVSRAFKPATLENREHGWITEYYRNNEKLLLALKHQTEAFEKVQKAVSPAQIPPHSVLPLNVVDPRFTMPTKRTKALTDREGNQKYFPQWFLTGAL